MVVTRSRSRWLVGSLLAVAALTVYANTVRNGWAWDDVHIIETNATVHRGDLASSLTSSYWPDAFIIDHGRLWRPLTVGVFTAEWSLFGDRPWAFHATNTVVHALVSVLVFLLLCEWVGLTAAAAGAAIFAVHPVHTEAVANVVGLSELGAAAGSLAACLLYLRLLEAASTWKRVALSLTIAACYLLALGFKEIAVTLPALLVLMAWGRERGVLRALLSRIWSDLPLYGLLTASLLGYLTVRMSILGVTLGDNPAPELIGLGTAPRLLTALSLWVDYTRLLLFPLELSADYGPGVRFPAYGIDGLVVAGAVILSGVIWGAIASRKKAPAIALGLAWIPVAILPVSHLLFPAGVLLGERTLYLASVGLAFVVGGLVTHLEQRKPAAVRIGLGVATAIVVVFGVRTWVRNPDWRNDEAVIASLFRDHPESHVVARIGALRDMRLGNEQAAVAQFDRVVRLRPNDFLPLTEAALYYELLGLTERAEAVLRQGTIASPGNPHSWALLARLRMEGGDARGARRIALEGAAASGAWLPDLWEIVADSYEAEERPLAAERARAMAIRGATFYDIVG